MTALTTHNLTKRYGARLVVDQVTLTAYPGEVFGFLGPNGAGKTTTLGMALVHPTAGEVRVYGQVVQPNRPAALNQVGALLGAPAYIPYLSAFENVRLVARLAPGVPASRLMDTLERVGLGAVAHHPVAGQFSTGLKQRLGLAQALVHAPRLLLLDEPTNGLDPAGMRDMRQLFRALAEAGTAVVLSSHLLNEVYQVCDRLAVLRRGQVVAQGAVGDLLRAHTPGVQVVVDDPTHAKQVLANRNCLPGQERNRLVGKDVTQRGKDISALFGNCLPQTG